MLKHDILRCKKSLKRGKKGTFIEGKDYLARVSKSGNHIVACSEEGQWVPVVWLHWFNDRGLRVLLRYFDVIEEGILAKNYKSLYLTASILKTGINKGGAEQ